MKVSLFITCVCDMFYANVGKDTVELLEKLGCEVDFPYDQTCCGQPAYNSGYLQDSIKTMKQTIRAFEDAEYVVGPSGSCVGMIKQYPEIFKGDPIWEEKAKKLANKSYELTEFIVNVLQIVDVGSKFEGTVTYHPSCHMTRILGVKEAPITLLENIKGVKLIDLRMKEFCCGFGGTFAVKNEVISTEMVTEKANFVSETEAEYLVGGDMACLMNIGGKLLRTGKNIKIIHIAEILNCS